MAKTIQLDDGVQIGDGVQITSCAVQLTPSSLLSASGMALLGGSRGAPLAPRLRDPTVTDDAAHGATVNMYWLNVSTGAIFKATSVANGAAVWVNQNVSAALPLDGLASASVAVAYGLNKLRAAYAGNCCIITRTSDSATLTLGFSGNTVDTSGVAAFSAGTTVKVTTWFDQSVANTGNAVQVALANAPFFLIDAQGVPHIQYDNASATLSLNLPAGLSITNPNMSIVTVQEPQRLNTGNIIVNLGPSSGEEYGVYQFANQTTIKTPTFLANDPFGFQGTTPSENGPGVYGQTQSAALGADLFVNEATSNAAVTGNVRNFLGGQIGTETLFNSNMSGSVDCLIIYTAKLSAANRLDLWLRLYRQYAIVLQRAMNNIVVWSDSIGSGTGTVGFRGWPFLANKQVFAPARLVNVGVPGQTAATADANYAAYITPLKQASARKNILIVAVGSNDLQAGTAGSVIWGSVQSIIAKGVVDGFTVLVTNLLPCGAGFETQRGNFNNLCNAGYIAAGASGLINVASDPLMGQAGQNVPPLYADTIHPSDSGAARLGTNYGAPTMQTALQ